MQDLATILLVDDEPMIIHVLSRTLRAKGYRVVSTTNPTEVMGLLEKEQVNILISDIDMPQMTGLTLMSLVRKEFPGVVRILMTGRGSMDSTLKAINEGEVYRFLTKPFRDEDLIAIIQEASSRIRELSRVSAAALIISRRDELCHKLEEQYPGLSQINQHDGVYLIPTDHIDGISSRLNNSKLSGLLRRKI